MNLGKKPKRALALMLSFIVLLVSCQLTALASEDEGYSNMDPTAEAEENTGGDASGEGTTGGETSGGETSGEETTDGETSGGEITGGETSGEETTGGETSGEDEVIGGITAKDVSVLKGDTGFHLLDGVKAKHETGAALTVEVTDDGGFDVNVAGAYTVTYGAGSGAYTAARTVTVFEFDYDAPPTSAAQTENIAKDYLDELLSAVDTEVELPVTAAELEEIIEEYRSDTSETDLPTLPKWKEAVDKDWLPGGWTQEELTDEETGAVYWSLTPYDFTYDEKPSTAAAVREITEAYISALMSVAESESSASALELEAAAEESPGLVGDALPVLPRWKSALQEALLPVGWTQADFTDEETGARYWMLRMSISARGGIIISPMSAAVNDLALLLQNVPATYDTFTDPYTNTLPQPMAITLQIQVKNTANLADDVVVVPVDCNYGHSEGGLTAARYFSFASASYGGTVVDSVTLSPGSGTNSDEILISPKTTVGVGTSETVTLYFNYNAQYNTEHTRVAPGTVLWPTVSAYVADKTDLDTVVESVTGANGIKTSAHDSKPVLLQPLTPTSWNGATEDSMIYLRFRANNNYQYESSLDFSKPNRFTVTMPSTLTDNTVTPAAVTIVSGNAIGTTATSSWTGYTNDGTNHILTKDFVGNRDGINGGWTNYNYNSVWETGTFFQRDVVIRIPDNVAPNTYQVTLKYEYYYVGDPTLHTSTETVPYIYTINALKDYEMTLRPATHTTGGSNLSQSGWEANNYCSTYVNALGWNDYGNSITSKNTGKQPIKQIEFTYYNSSDQEKKLNFYDIQLGVTREFSNTPFGSYEYTINIYTSTKSGGTITNSPSRSITGQVDFGASSSTSTNLTQTIFASSLHGTSLHTSAMVLGSNEYVDNVVITPYGSNYSSLGDLLSKNGFYLRYRIQGWGNHQWPDGEVMLSSNTVSSYWTFKYQPNKSPDTSRITSTGSSMTHTYVATNSVNAFASMTTTSGGTVTTANPFFDCTITGFHRDRPQTIGWTQPGFTIRVPKHLTIDTAGPLTGSTGTYPMDWKLIDDTHTDFRIYWIYNDVSGGPADQFQAAANTFGTSNQLFTIPVRFQVLGNPPSGAYEQFAMAVSSGIGQVMNTGVYGDTYLTYPTIPPTTEETYDNNYNFANAPQNIKHFYFVNRQVSTEAKLFSYTINSNVSMSPSTQIQSAANDPSSGYWLTTSNAQPLSPADWNEDVAVKLVMENKGNETVTNIGLYDIIPSNGYRPFGSAQYESTGDIDFIGIKGLPGTAQVYYYTGSPATLPALDDIVSIRPALSNTSLWTPVSLSPTSGAATYETAGYGSPVASNVLAVYIDYGAYEVAGNDALDSTELHFKTAPSGSQIVYNAFTFVYNTKSGVSVPSPYTSSQIHGFSTLFLHFVYHPNDASASNGSTYVDNALFPAREHIVKGLVNPNSLDISPLEPKRPGYTFQYWRGTLVRNGVVIRVDNYNPGDTIVVLALTPDLTNEETLNLVAVWEANKYTLTFDKNGGTTDPTPASKTVTFDQPIGSIPQGSDIPGRMGRYASYSFLGWTWTPNSRTIPDVFSTDIYTIPDHSTVYARWLRIPSEPNGGIYEGPDMDRMDNAPWPLGGEEAITDPDDVNETAVDAIDTTQWDDPPTFNPETGDSRTVLSIAFCAACIAAGAVFLTRTRKRKH